jgi:hypothetical protein
VNLAVTGLVGGHPGLHASSPVHARRQSSHDKHHQDDYNEHVAPVVLIFVYCSQHFSEFNDFSSKVNSWSVGVVEYWSTAKAIHFR